MIPVDVRSPKAKDNPRGCQREVLGAKTDPKANPEGDLGGLGQLMGAHVVLGSQKWSILVHFWGAIFGV